MVQGETIAIQPGSRGGGVVSVMSAENLPLFPSDGTSHRVGSSERQYHVAVGIPHAPRFEGKVSKFFSYVSNMLEY